MLVVTTVVVVTLAAVVEVLVVVILRIDLFAPSVIYRLFDESIVRNLGLLNKGGVVLIVGVPTVLPVISVVTLPSVAPDAPPINVDTTVEATTADVPDPDAAVNVILRIQLLPKSVIYKLLDVSQTIERGLVNLAFVGTDVISPFARPNDPAVPASVLTVPFVDILRIT